MDVDNSVLSSKHDSKLFTWGLILNILGVSISIILKKLTGNDSSVVTNAILAISILLVIDWNRVLLTPVIIKSTIYALIFVLQLYIIWSAILAETPLLNSSNALIYTIYVVVFFFALTINQRQLDEHYIMVCMLYVTAVLNVIAFILIIQNGGTLYMLNESVVSMEGGIERSTLSGIPFYYIVAFLTSSKEIRKNKIWWILMGVALINMLACNRRTVYLSVLFCLILLLIKRPLITFNVTKERLFHYAVAILAIVIVFKSLNSISWINEMVTYSLESLNRGINTFFSNEYEDASVLVRNQNRELALGYLKDNTMIQWLFGRGYAFKWIDFPILEAVLDLGMIMGGIYTFLFVVYPIVGILKLKKPSDFELFISACMISALLSSFSSGMPYGYTKYCPLILFAYVLEQRKKSEYSDDNLWKLEEL